LHWLHHWTFIPRTLKSRDGTTIFYKEWGSGRPIVFSHGWLLDADAWDAQMLFLGMHGYRVIAHDRRGHGRSDQSCRRGRLARRSLDIPHQPM
jgi:pimeloyl-ACP methyl ester carboxylesterase